MSEHVGGPSEPFCDCMVIGHARRDIYNVDLHIVWDTMTSDRVSNILVRFYIRPSAATSSRSDSLRDVTFSSAVVTAWEVGSDQA